MISHQPVGFGRSDVPEGQSGRESARQPLPICSFASRCLEQYHSAFVDPMADFGWMLVRRVGKSTQMSAYL
jgi:hypothetical protein